MALSSYQILLAVGMLLTGSINTISKKAQNDCNVPGYYNYSANGTATTHEFDHPWFQTIIMFIGESLCLVGLAISRKKERDQWKKENAEREREGKPVENLQQGGFIKLILAVPTCLDLIGTSLAGIGLVYVNASVWQMLRGSIIVFAGILSKIFLKRNLKCHHWTGMFVTVIGLVLVGISSVFKGESSKGSGSEALLGIALILGGQVISASQMIVEEMFLKKRNYHPLQVVGMEGTYGFLIMAAAVLPAMYFIPGPQLNNSYENSLDALYQIGKSPRLLIFCLLYLFSIAFYNYFGLAVTKSLTAVHRTLLDACRTIVVWIVDLIIYYAFDKGFGEEFDKTWGLLQVDGFLFLLIGTALYNELVDVSWLPCMGPSQQELQQIQPEDSAAGEAEGEDEADERTRLIKDNRGSINA
ncbi:solute carrier family 35 member F6-like [Lineus longissimus]|uniref:solute carrier family 35 member F6-like n=1 Tax=Lineus longissimus TaxID=88925 RepID=UPI002B4F93A7